MKMDSHFIREITLKKYLYLVLLVIASYLKGQVVNVSGSWLASVPSITEAGNNYSGTYDNTGSTSTNQITLSGTLPGSFLNLLSTKGANMTMHYVSNPWNSSMILSAKKTGGTTAIHGVCLLCTATINGGATYIPIPETSDVIFLSFTFAGLLGLGNSVTFSDINLILQLSGVSVTIPANNYNARVVFTIVAN